MYVCTCLYTQTHTHIHKKQTHTAITQNSNILNDSSIAAHWKLSCQPNALTYVIKYSGNKKETIPRSSWNNRENVIPSQLCIANGE